MLAPSRLSSVAIVSTALLKAVLSALNSTSVGVPDMVPTPLCAGLLGAVACASVARNVSCALPPSRVSRFVRLVVCVVMAVVFAVAAVVFAAMSEVCFDWTDSTLSRRACARVTWRP